MKSYICLSQGQDMIEIVAYISHEFASPIAVAKLAEELIAAADKLAKFPYAHTACFPIRPLKREYRKLLVQNYVMIYFIEEEKKHTTIFSKDLHHYKQRIILWGEK